MFQQVTKVVTYYFCCFIFLPYYFFCSKTMLHRCFFTRFSVFFEQKSEKIWQFFAIFSRCVSMIYEKVEKIIGQNY